MFKVIAGNDQLIVFMIFAMISNAGWYLTSGTAVYYGISAIVFVMPQRIYITAI